MARKVEGGSLVVRDDERVVHVPEVVIDRASSGYPSDDVNAALLDEGAVHLLSRVLEATHDDRGSVLPQQKVARVSLVDAPVEILLEREVVRGVVRLSFDKVHFDFSPLVPAPLAKSAVSVHYTKYPVSGGGAICSIHLRLSH